MRGSAAPWAPDSGRDAARDNGDAVAKDVERAGDRDVDRIQCIHGEALEFRLGPMGATGRNLRLAEPDDLEADRLHEPCERPWPEFPKMIRRLAHSHFPACHLEAPQTEGARDRIRR